MTHFPLSYDRIKLRKIEKYDGWAKEKNGIYNTAEIQVVFTQKVVGVFDPKEIAPFEQV